MTHPAWPVAEVMVGSGVGVLKLLESFLGSGIRTLSDKS